MLQVFLNLSLYPNDKLMLIIGMHLAFVISALMLGFLEKIMAMAKGAKI